MRNSKRLGLTLATISAIGLVAVAGAQAGSPHWTTVVSGVSQTLGAGVEETQEGVSTGVLSIKAPFVNLKSTNCKIHGKIIGTGVGSPGTYTGSFHCEGMEVEGAPKCIVKSEGAATNGTFQSKLFTGTLVWLKQRPDITSVGLTLKADSGTEIANIEITGAGCAATNHFAMSGNLICTTTPVGEDVENGTLDCPSTTIKKYFTNQTPTRTEDEDSGPKISVLSATIIAHFVNIHLTSALKWGIENGA